MFGKIKSQAIIAGAGPVGLLTALQLAERGIQVEVVDKAERTNLHSYALAVHPRSLELLRNAGLLVGLLARGHKIERVALYDGAELKTVIGIANLPGSLPFLLVVPQNALEELLVERLSMHGIKVRWNRELEEVTAEPDSVLCEIAKIEEVLQGYPFMRMERATGGREKMAAPFLVGADGYHSFVRGRLGLDYDLMGPRMYFSVFELATNDQQDAEMRIVIRDGKVAVMWPMRDGHVRWSFQRDNEDQAGRTRQGDLEEALRHFAPWFSTEGKRIFWSSSTYFEPRLAKAFGHGRVWLAGDAAHMTSPVGVQSMNEGLFEATELARVIHKVIEHGGPMTEFDEYGARQMKVWKRLLSVSPLKGMAGVDPWIEANSAILRSSLPLSGVQLATALGKLGLEFADGVGVSAETAAT